MADGSDKDMEHQRKSGRPLDYVANPEKTQREFTEAEMQALQDVIAYATNEDKTEQFY